MTRIVTRIGVPTGLAMAALSSAALAQGGGQGGGGFQAPPPPAPIMAEYMLDKKVISTAAAQKMVAVCEAYAKAHNTRVAIWVLNDAGTPAAMLRMEGTQVIGVDTALMKAKTALGNRRDSSPDGALKGFINNPNNPTGEVMLLQLNQYPVSGGIAIISDGQVIGAIGVGGAGPVDEACAKVAVDAISKK